MGVRDRSEPRDGYAVRVLAVHTTEGGGTAQSLRDAAWWEGSSHAIADENTLLTPAEGCVPYDRASWTLRSGNRWSENIELIAQAGWSRAEWLDRPTLLNLCARWLADRSKARGIPLVKLTPAQYRAGGRGVIGHNDHTVGYSDGTHWDPGPGFPWDVVLDKARKYAAGQQEDDVSAAEVWLTETKNPQTGSGVQYREVLWAIYGHTVAAAQDAAVARKFAEAAAKGVRLSDEERARIVEETAERFAEDFTLQGTAVVQPKPGA